MNHSLYFFFLFISLSIGCLAKEDKKHVMQSKVKQDYSNLFNYLGTGFGCKSKFGWTGIKLLSKHIVQLENGGDSDTEYYRTLSYGDGKLTAENFMQGHHSITTSIRKHPSLQPKIELTAHKSHWKLTIFRTNPNGKETIICKPGI